MMQYSIEISSIHNTIGRDTKRLFHSRARNRDYSFSRPSTAEALQRICNEAYSATICSASPGLLRRYENNRREL